METNIKRKRRYLDLNKLLGRRLAQIRHESGVKQEEVADAMDIKRPLVSKIENGHRALDAMEIPDYAAAIHVEPDVIFSEIDKIVIEYDSRTGRSAQS
ncbi:MAG: helix-turn-helix transcriptional regulator [Coriobacteriales bacterium]|nr:helix-turn-helix transcriptional regulator [Coriobacteriales bacterium]